MNPSALLSEGTKARTASHARRSQSRPAHDRISLAAGSPHRLFRRGACFFQLLCQSRGGVEAGTLGTTMTHPTVPVAIALGSNLGDRRAHIEAALAALGRVPGIRLIARGPIIENPAMSKRGVNVGGPYLNTACVLLTSLDPHQLLGRLHHIERDHGRERSPDRVWEERTLDLDIVLYGDDSIDDDGLTVPHPRMHERRFVLEPLAAIAPAWPVPGRDASVKQLLGNLLRDQRAKAASGGKRTKSSTIRPK